MAGHPDFDQMTTTTLNHYRRRLEDVVFTDRPLLDFLKRANQIDKIDGGNFIIEELMYGPNTTVGSFGEWDTLDLAPQDGITAAVYPWRLFAGTIAISNLQKAQNSGRAAQIKLLKAKVMQLEESLSEKLDEMLFGDGSGNSGKDMYGLDLLINDHNASVTTVGGIDCSDPDNDWWRSVVVDASADGDPERSDDEWTNAYYTASKGNIHPDFAITTQELFEHYESGLAPQLRFTSNEKADARFQSLAFKGIRLYFDSYCPEGDTFFLNSRNIKLSVHKDNYFRNDPFETVPDKDAAWSKVVTYGNLTTNNRRRHARVTNQTVS